MVVRLAVLIFLSGMIAVPVFGQGISPFCLTHSRSEHRNPLPITGKAPERTIREKEPADRRGENDTQGDAEVLGTLEAQSSFEISGTLSPEPPIHRPSPERETMDDGAIHLARDLEIKHGTRVKTHGAIGDGPHGSGGRGTGDFDFYKMGRLVAGQTVTIDIDTPLTDSSLDSKVALYDSTGFRLESNDNGIHGTKDSYLEVVIPASGSYFAVVRGINSWWPEDPFDPGSGPKAGSEGPYEITLGIDAEDLDWYRVYLQAGDVLSIAVQDAALHLMLADINGAVQIASALDRSDLFPRNSPLLRGGNANIALVIAETGNYNLRVAQGSGSYTAILAAHRAGPKDSSARQVLFIDFDGAELDAQMLGGRSDARLSPLSQFLEKQGIGHQEDYIIDLSLAALTENLIHDLQEELGGNLSLEILNSKDDLDPWGAPNVTRIIVGGSQGELGLQTTGIAESVDVGNFVLNETAVILLDRITDPSVQSSFSAVERAPGVSMADLLGLALGNVIAHEAGHLLAGFHTGHADYPWQIMDANPEPAGFVGAGPDKILGTGDDLDIDFGISPYWKLEGFDGHQDSRSAIIYGIGSSQVTGTLNDKSPYASSVSERIMGTIYPNPSNHQAWFPATFQQTEKLKIEVYDLLGRLQMTISDEVIRNRKSDIPIPVDQLIPGTYVLYAKYGGGFVSRKFVVIR